ncbi:protein expanded-like isoform X1 [Macrobrachium rosenbergii]|uniref:protein expanded-like isoform X1 n=1 Tax=Macrobrachium rosenbergii TaxID=79674 RepID=UPI0034D680F3
MVTGSGVGTSCSVSPHHKYVAVSFLTQETITFTTEVKSRVRELQSQVYACMQQQGMQDADLFGLAVTIDGEYVFPEPDNKLSKYAPKAWKTSPNGLDSNGEPLLQFKFRVQFYVETELLLRDQLSRLHYYLQLRENVLTYNQPIPKETAFVMASYALQADLGDFCHDPHSQQQYFEPSLYFPQWLVERVGVPYIMENVPLLHRDNLGLTRAEAQAHYIREASQQEAPHNLHLYRLRCKKQEPTPQVAMAICAKGVELYEDDMGGSPTTSRKLISNFQWSNIGELSFEKKKFEIRALSYSEKLTYYTTSDDKSRHLLYLCRCTHLFNMNQQPRLAEVRRLQEEDRRRYRESYIYGDRYGEIGGLADGLGGLRGYLGKTSADQRVSVISNTSSNTTSGIVSDRVLSLDGSEDDLDSEIMINTPPAASIESGVESLTRSLSRLDSSASSTHGHTPDYDEGNSSQPSFTPPTSDSPSGAAGMTNSVGLCGSESGGASLGRAGSVHSSSSQHSASTVRSRYSLVPPRLAPELTLGAELGSLQLTRDIPHLADLPGMAAERPGRGEDEESELCAAISHTQHNCCSTCCDDNASITSTDDLEETRHEQHCKCGSCAMCILQAASAEFLHKKLDSEASSVAVQRGDAGPHTYHDSIDSGAASAHFFGSATYVSDNASVMVQPDLDESVTSTYNFSEEDFSQLDNNDDYVEFFKDGLRYPEQGALLPAEEIPEEIASPNSVHRHSPQGLGAQGLVAQRVSSQGTPSQPEAATTPTGSEQQDEEHLDYSVESAQAVLSTSYSPALAVSLGRYRPRASVSSTFDTDSDYVQVPGSEGHFIVLPPAPVSMSTVTTVTPVAIASSRINAASTNEPLPKVMDPAGNSRSSTGMPEAIISETTVANASEAPAKFITSRPRITVQKAHTQQATTATPSFTSVPLSRGMMHTLPQFQPRPKIDPVQSLQRGANHLPELRPLGLPPLYARDHRSNKTKVTGIPSTVEVPVIRKNNYLDVRASSSMNKNKARIHPEQLPHIHPRSLFLRHQQKALQQEQLKQQQLQKRQSSETVYQPALYAQGVGVPLLPSPTYTGYQQQPHQHSQSQTYQQPAHNFISSQHHQHQPQQAIHQQHQQNYIYQPYNIKNFFQNPPPPSPHLGYGVGAGPGGSGYQVTVEAPSPPYQCASDPGTYSPQHHHLATVYTNQLSSSYIEQFKAQLYSDVDYVIYPMKDPALSRQEYIDAKQGQALATQAQQSGSSSSSSFAYMAPPPPPYRGPKMSPLYRSTPNVAATLSSCSVSSTTGPVSGGGSASLLSSYPSYQSLASHQPGSSSGYSSMVRGRYFSQQSLASSSLSSAPSGYSASTQSLTGSYEPYSEVMRASSMMRVRSDESILSSALADSSESPQAPAGHILPPPPPYRPKETLDNTGDAPRTTSGGAGRSRGRKSGGHLNLQQLRERSQLMDVPLIAALCSDTTLVSNSRRTPSTDSSSTPNSNCSASASEQHHNPGAPSGESQNLDPVQAASHLTQMIAPSVIDKSRSNTRGLKATQRYSLSGVYTTNQVPVTHIKSKCSGKTFSGVHHHPSRADVQIQPTPAPLVNDPIKTKLSP